MKKEYVRRVIVFEDHFKEFRKNLDKDALKKLYQVLILIMTAKIVSTKFLKSVEGWNGLYEIRSESRGNIYRVFCCFDEDYLVILFNGFQKKTNKTPIAQIMKANALMKKYFEQKKSKKDG